VLEKEIEAIGTHVHLLEKEWAILGFLPGSEGEAGKVDLSGFQAYILKRFPLLENVQWIPQAFKRITTRAGHIGGEGTTEVSQSDFPLLLRAYYYLARLHLAFPNVEADGQENVDLEEFRGGHQWLGLSLRHVYSKVAFMAMDSQQTGAITFEQVSEWYFGQKGLGFLEDLEYGSEARKQLAYLPKQLKDPYFSKPSATSYLSKQSKYVFPKRGSLSPTKPRGVNMEEATSMDYDQDEEGVDTEAGALSATTSGRTSVVAPTSSKKSEKGSKGSVRSPQMLKATAENLEAPSEAVIEMESGLGATIVTEETKEDATRPGKGMDSRGGSKNKRGLPEKVANAKSRKPDRNGKSPAKSKKDVGAVKKEALSETLSETEASDGTKTKDNLANSVSGKPKNISESRKDVVKEVVEEVEASDEAVIETGQDGLSNGTNVGDETTTPLTEPKKSKGPKHDAKSRTKVAKEVTKEARAISKKMEEAGVPSESVTEMIQDGMSAVDTSVGATEDETSPVMLPKKSKKGSKRGVASSSKVSEVATDDAGASIKQREEVEVPVETGAEMKETMAPDEVPSNLSLSPATAEGTVSDEGSNAKSPDDAFPNKRRKPKAKPLQ
jgi:hypothetical protein